MFVQHILNCGKYVDGEHLQQNAYYIGIKCIEFLVHGERKCYLSGINCFVKMNSDRYFPSVYII